MPEAEPVASVLVPVLDEADRIRETAAAMLGQTGDVPFEVLFIDGGSTDGTPAVLAEIAAADPRVRVLENPHRVTPHALNIGLRAARGRIVVRMDAHTYYPPDYLARGIERLDRGDASWVSGPQLPVGVDRGSRRVALALSTKLGTGGASFRHAGEAEHDAETGFTGLFDRAVLERVGGWDEGWVINQDAELGARFAAAGERMVVVPALAAEYVPRRTLKALARQYARYGFYRCKTCLRHPQSMRRGHVLPPAVTLVVAAALLPLGPQRRPARAATALYLAALAGAGVDAAGRAPASDAAAVPVVLATMHLSWGAGFLVACARLGPPLPALRGLLRR